MRVVSFLRGSFNLKIACVSICLAGGRRHVVPVEVVDIEITCWGRHVSVPRHVRVMFEEEIIRLPHAILVLIRIPLPIPKSETTRSCIPIWNVLLATRPAEIVVILPSRAWRTDPDELIDRNFSCWLEGVCTVTSACGGGTSILLASSVSARFLRGTLFCFVRKVFVRTITWK